MACVIRLALPSVLFPSSDTVSYTNIRYAFCCVLGSASDEELQATARPARGHGSRGGRGRGSRGGARGAKSSGAASAAGTTTKMTSRGKQAELIDGSFSL